MLLLYSGAGLIIAGLGLGAWSLMTSDIPLGVRFTILGFGLFVVGLTIFSIFEDQL